MRFKLMVVAASSAGLLSSTMAQAEEATNFVGPSIALGAGYFAPKMGVIKNNPATFGKIDSSRKKGFIPTVDLSYGFPMGSSAVGSVGMTYDIGKSKISEFKAQSDKTKIASQVRGDISLKNHAHCDRRGNARYTAHHHTAQYKNFRHPSDATITDVLE